MGIRALPLMVALVDARITVEIGVCGYFGYDNFWPAVVMAAEWSRLSSNPVIDIAAMTNVSSDFNLKFHFNDTRLKTDVTRQIAMDWMGGSNPVTAVIGCMSSGISDAMARAGGLFKTPQLSWLSGSARFTKDRTSFSYFMRTIAAMAGAQSHVTWLMKAYNWTRATMLYSDDPYIARYERDVFVEAVKIAQRHNINIDGVPLAFAHSPNNDGSCNAGYNMTIGQKCVAKDGWRNAITKCKLLGNVIYIIAQAVDGASFLQMAHDAKLSQFLWILIHVDNFERGFAAQNLSTKYEGSLGTVTAQDPHLPASGRFQKYWTTDIDLAKVRPYVGPDIYAYMETHTWPTNVLWKYRIYLFDCVVALQIAIGRILRRDGLGPNGANLRNKNLLDELMKVSFSGVSGDVVFDKNGDRVGTQGTLRNLQNESWIAVGSISPHGIAFTPGAKIIFPGGSNTAPTGKQPTCDEGKHFNGTQCDVCPVGQEYAPHRIAIGRCAPCLPGKAGKTSPSGGILCELCPKGSFANISGLVGCYTCDIGSFSADIGHSHCIMCPKGKMQEKHGQSGCDHCQVGRYSNNEGRTACEKCATLLTTDYVGKTSANDCVCAAGTYKPEITTGKACWPCPGGMTCQIGSDARDVFVNGGRSPMIKEGFMSRPTEPMLVYKCGLSQHCPGGWPGVCAKKRDPMEVACGKCVEGTYEAESECKRCGDNGLSVLPLIITSIVGLCGVCIGTLVVTRNMIMHVRSSSMMVVILTGLMFTAIQTLGVFDQLLIQWFEPIASVLRIVSLLSFDLKLLRLECLAQTSVATMYLCRQLIAPMIIPFIAFTLIAKKILKPMTHFLVELMNSVGTMFSMLFISIVVSSMTPLICYKHPEPNRLSSMVSAPSILCFTGGDHTTMVVIGISAFCTLPLLVLCMAFYFTYIYPFCIRGRVSHSDLKLGVSRFFFFRFRPERYYFGSILLARSLALCLVPVCISDDVGLQICSLVMIILGFLMLQQQLNPWRSYMLNLMDGVLNMFLALLLVCGSVGIELKGGPTSSVKFVGIFCFVASASATIIIMAFAILNKFYPTPYYHRFICHHKQDAAAQARFLKLQLAFQTGQSIFIDSDDLQELGLLFGIVRNNIGQLIVYLTRDTLSRPWCAGEIVTAFAITRVKVIIVRTPSFEALPQHQAEAFASSVVLVDCTLTEHGISKDNVVQAYGRLLSTDTPYFTFDEATPCTLRFYRLVNSILAKKTSDCEQKTSIPQKAGMVLVSADPDQDESCAAAGIMISKIKRGILQKSSEGICCLVDVVYDQTALAPVVAAARAVIVILSEASLYSSDQLHCIVECVRSKESPQSDGKVEVRMFGSSSLPLFSSAPSEATPGSAAVIPVNLPTFQFPSEHYYTTSLPKMVGNAETVVTLIREFFKSISISFATHASDAMIDTQCVAVVARVPEQFDVGRAKLRLTTKTDDKGILFEPELLPAKEEALPSTRMIVLPDDTSTRYKVIVEL